MKNRTYTKVMNNHPVKKPILLNGLKALVFGGLIGVFGQLLIDLFYHQLSFSKEDAQSLMMLVVIFITSLLTGFGKFDHFGEIAGAGSYIPLTGFANSVCSSALDGKSEGIFKGILFNTFKLAGAILATGFVSATFIGFIIYLFRRG